MCRFVGYQVDSLVLPIANVCLARSQFGAIVADLYQFTVILMFAGFKGRRIGEARIVIDSHDIASMKVCQIQKDRDKQARCKCSILHFNIEFCDFSGIRGRRIGEASNPGPRLRRRGPRSVEARTERRQRREAPTTAGGSEGCEELNLTMLHLNLRGFLSHIAEVTAVM